MNRAILLISLALPLAACGSEPAVSEENASVEEVAERVREASDDQGLVQPGKWVSTVTIEEMTVPNMPPEAAEQMKRMFAQAKATEVCLTPEEAKQPRGEFFAGNADCRYDRFTMDDGRIDAVMRCERDGTAQVMRMEGTYSPTSYEMRMATTVEGAPGAESISMQMRVEAERVGECEGEQG